MRRFYYIDNNEQEQLDLIDLLEGCSDGKLTYDECVLMLKDLQCYVNITPKQNNN